MFSQLPLPFFLPLRIPVLKWLLLLTIDKFIHYDYDAIRTVVVTRDPLGIYAQRKILLSERINCVNRRVRSVGINHGEDNTFSIFRLSKEDKPVVYTVAKFGLWSKSIRTAFFLFHHTEMERCWYVWTSSCMPSIIETSLQQLSVKQSSQRSNTICVVHLIRDVRE
jgi:hypothetical protein